jgi:shikimate dehydrogenase
VGHNTDAAGACAALSEATELSGTRVLVIGAGGAARAVAHGLIDAGASVSLVNRTKQKAELLAAQIRAATDAEVAARGLSELTDLKDVEVLVNASAAGMKEYGAGSPINVEWLHRGLVVMDIVYKPVHTLLIEAALEKGLKAISGERMLLHQAARQFELYTGAPAPLTAMEQALARHISG